MIVVDTSVWIDYLRDTDNPATRKLKATDTLDLILGDIVLLELLQGAQDDLHADAIQSRLCRLQRANMLNTKLAIRAAGYYRQLRRAGRTVRTMPDLVIATYCIEHGHLLLHNDRDFSVMEKHLGLRVL